MIPWRQLASSTRLVQSPSVCDILVDARQFVGTCASPSEPPATLTRYRPWQRSWWRWTAALWRAGPVDDVVAQRQHHTGEGGDAVPRRSSSIVDRQRHGDLDVPTAAVQLGRRWRTRFSRSCLNSVGSLADTHTADELASYYVTKRQNKSHSRRQMTFVYRQNCPLVLLCVSQFIES